jgi:hypothetical protein
VAGGQLMRLIDELGRHRRIRTVELRVPVNPAELSERIRQGATRLEIDLSREDLTLGIPKPIAEEEGG